MLKNLSLSLSCIASLFLLAPALAADKTAEAPKKTAAEAKPASDVTNELKEIVTSVREKLKAGKKSEADLADELKRFDELLAKHKDEKTEDVANVAFMKATLYTEVIKDEAKGKEMLEQVAKDYPDTRAAKSASASLKSIEAKAKFAIGKPFPEFSVTGFDGKPLAVSDYKGKVVLIDFWATWCGPCIGELPNVKKTYAKHHDKGFEIIGISLDSDKDKLTEFLAKNEIGWRQFFDGGGWKNKLAVEYSVQSIPATYLLDGEGKIIGSNLRGEELEAAVEKALKKDTKEAKDAK